MNTCNLKTRCVVCVGVKCRSIWIVHVNVATRHLLETWRHGDRGSGVRRLCTKLPPWGEERAVFRDNSLVFKMILELKPVDPTELAAPA